jgi:hypothetical protein
MANRELEQYPAGGDYAKAATLVKERIEQRLAQLALWQITDLLTAPSVREWQLAELARVIQDAERHVVPDSDQERELARLTEAYLERLYEEEAKRAPQAGANQMRMLDPEDDAGTPGDRSLTDQDKQLVNGAVGFPSPGDQQQQALNQHTGTPLTEPNPQDLQLPGAPLTGEQPAAHTHLATASDGAASDQATTTSWSSYLKAGLGAGGAVVLTAAALTLLAGCGRGGGPACYAVLAPVLSRLGLTSARPEPVYGPEHG